MAPLKIFVSSTCYDLSQIRKDISDCIKTLGYHPILSEKNSFPVNPDLSSSENCINVVKNKADIFVLIIGSRYGSTLDTGKSITNTEFSAAIDKGIPIYTFTIKEMIELLHVWKKDPSQDFSNRVDNNKIFEFINEVREKRGLWNFEFEGATDIVETLKIQLSNLFQDSLEIRKKFNSYGDKSLCNNLSVQALNLIFEKKEYYEMKFFMQTMSDEIKKYNHLKNDYKYSIIIKSTEKILKTKDFLDWIQFKFDQQENCIKSINKLNTAFRSFYGNPGITSDLNGLYYIACTYARLYASLLEWGIEIRSLICSEEHQKIISFMAEFPSKAIEQIEAFPINSLKKIDESIEKHKNGEIKEGAYIELSLKVSIDENVWSNYNNELNNLRKKISQMQ